MHHNNDILRDTTGDTICSYGICFEVVTHYIYGKTISPLFPVYISDVRLVISMRDGALLVLTIL